MTDLLDDVVHVNIELSNLCNYSYLHKKCPASTRKEKQIMPRSVVIDILDTLGKYKYGKGKSIAFYLYNDSMNDPRLFSFLEYAKEKCPEANKIVGTNGWYLTENITYELFDAGCTFLLVSSYTDEEHKRLTEIRRKVAQNVKGVSFCIRRVKSLDNRINSNNNSKSGVCYAPLTEILVCPDGRTRLCCIDMNQEVPYGDVGKDGFEKVMIDNHKMLSDLRDELVNGVRNLDLCKRCMYNGRMYGLYKSKSDPRPCKDLLKG